MGRKFKEVDPDLIGPDYAHDEDEIARLCGVQKHTVQILRERVGSQLEGRYAILDGAVLYSRDGLSDLMRLMGILQNDIWVEKVAESSRIGPDWKKLREGCLRAAVTVITTNRSIIMARLIGTEEPRTVRVYVGISDNFIPGMELVVRMKEPPELYELVGARPRQRGMW